MFRNPGRTVFVVAALSLPVVISAQTEGARPSDGEIYEIINHDVYAEFPGGEKAMMDFIAKELGIPHKLKSKGRSWSASL